MAGKPVEGCRPAALGRDIRAEIGELEALRVGLVGRRQIESFSSVERDATAIVRHSWTCDENEAPADGRRQADSAGIW